MSDEIVTKKFVLVGPYAGQTRTFGPKAANMMTKNFEFEDGAYMFTGSSQEALRIGTYLRKSYQAYPEGPELDAAQAAWDKEHGEKKPAAKKQTAKKKAPAKTQTTPPAGDNEDAPETVADALQALDADNDDHWNSRKQPSVDAVAELMGRSVTRQEIEEAVPGFSRPA